MPRLCRCGRIVKDACQCGRGSSTERRNTSREGHGQDHRKASERYRAAHPLCERCVQLFGVVDAKPSRDMHHIHSIASSPERRMDPNNWLAVCFVHHEELEGDPLEGMACKRWSLEHYDKAMGAE